MVRFLIYTLLTLLVATCGQKGPLYLPDDEKPQSTHEAFYPVSWWTNRSRMPE